MRRLKTQYKTELGISVCFSVFVFSAADVLDQALDCLHTELMSEELLRPIHPLWWSVCFAVDASGGPWRSKHACRHPDATS